MRWKQWRRFNCFMLHFDSRRIRSAALAAPVERFWCCLCVWRLMYKPAWPCCAAQRETFNRLCFLRVAPSFPCASRCSNVFNCNFHCATTGPLAQAAMMYLSKTIWEIEESNALRLVPSHDAKSTESWGRASKTERVIWSSNSKSGDEKVQRMKRRCAHTFHSCRGEERERWERKLAVRTISGCGSERKMRNSDKGGKEKEEKWGGWQTGWSDPGRSGNHLEGEKSEVNNSREQLWWNQTQIDRGRHKKESQRWRQRILINYWRFVTLQKRL